MARGTMPPPGLAVIIHPGGGPPDAGPKGGGPKMPPPGQELEHAGGNKATPEEAGVIRDDEHCSNCTHYVADTGECEKVEGYLSPDDTCEKYFEPLKGDSDEPDSDEQGGPSDNDADDQPGGQAA